MTTLSTQPEFKTGYLEGYFEADPYASEEDALFMLDMFSAVFSFIKYASIIFLIFGIVALVLVIIVKKSNVKGIGIYLLILSILHIISGRILAFIFLLIGSIKFIQHKDVPQQEMNYQSY